MSFKWISSRTEKIDGSVSKVLSCILSVIPSTWDPEITWMGYSVLLILVLGRWRQEDVWGLPVKQRVLLSEHQVPRKDSMIHKKKKKQQIHKPSWVVRKEELYWKLSSSFHIGLSHRICSDGHSFTFWFYKFLKQIEWCYFFIWKLK